MKHVAGVPTLEQAEIDAIAAAAVPISTLKESSGPTTMTVGAVSDGQFLKRNGTTLVGAAIAGGGDLLAANNLSDLANAATARTNLGLGSAATTASTAYATAAQGSTADAAAPATRAINNGYGISGGGNLSADRTLAVGLTSSSAFATAETTISAATYADITGASVSLAAGTWLVIGQVNCRAANAITQAFVAITDGSNNVVSEAAGSRPASGTASLNSPFTVSVTGIVSPASTTTYKLRAARGLTTHTASWTAMDGNGVNTTNHASNNTDKGTGIFAVRIA